MIVIRYTLYNEPNDELSSLSQILLNREIPLDEQDSWLNAGWESINDWLLLNDGSKLSNGVDMVRSCVENNEDIMVVVDADADGSTSSSIFINYLYALYPEYVESHVSWIMHKGKQHGLADIVDEILKEKPSLVLSPDGSSNDYEQQRLLNDNGINVLVLDHHQCDKDYTDTNRGTIIVNVQISDYPNKALTGAGVVWQFCRAYDELYPDAPDHLPHANDFLDLAAIGDAGDMADYHEREIRAIMNLGLKEMRNPFLYRLAEKNRFILDKRNGMNYLSVAFGIVPFINACHRSGTMDEKEAVFEGMLTHRAMDMVQSSKRGETGISVPLCQEAVTLVDRIKRRQSALEKDAMTIIDERIEEENLTDNAIIAVVVSPDECEASICGLAANKIQSKYQHPAIVLRRTKPRDSHEEVYSGSARNFSLCDIKDMRGLCESTGDTVFAAGHDSAFGIAISESDFDDFVSKTNDMYDGIDFTPSYMVDYEWNERTIDPQRIMAIGNLDVYGQGIGESLVALRDIPLSKSNVTLLGLAKGHPTLKIQCGSVSIMKFGSSEEEFKEFTQENSYLTCVGKCSVNRWMGNESPQILIDDFEVRQEWIF